MMSENERNVLMDIHRLVGIVASRVEDHHKTLYGNGKPGLKERVQAVEQTHNDCPARLAMAEGRSAPVRQGWWQVLLSTLALAVAIASLYFR